MKSESCSLNTIIKYLGYLEEAYIIEIIKQYSTKTKSELAYYVKIYDTDVAFNSIRCMDNRYDLTHNLENIIYNELKYMGYHINVFNNNGKEKDTCRRSILGCSLFLKIHRIYKIKMRLMKI